MVEQGDDAIIWNFGAKRGNEEILFSRIHATLNVSATEDIRPISELQEWLNEGHTIVMHNGTTFDGEALILLGYDISNNFIVDSLYLAWYLDPRRKMFGLAHYGEIFGVPKPVVQDGEWLGCEDQGEFEKVKHQELMNNRVMMDCRIQDKLWQKQLKQLVALYGSEEKAWRLIDYLMIKAKHLTNQQRTRWKLDVEGSEKLSEELTVDKEIRFQELSAAMPRMPTYKDKKRPKKPFKANGELSGYGIKWVLFCLQYGIEFNSLEEYKYEAGTVAGNPNSHAQVKEWLFNLGWKPETFQYKMDICPDTGKRSERKIPQINVKNSGGRLDPDIERMVEDNENLKPLAGLSIVNHRLGIVNGFLRDHVDGYLVAACQGLTNTLRLKHKIIANVPSDRVPYGERLRALLIADEGYLSLGTDLSSLEDRCKHHYQMPLDPAYVEEQSHPDFDPHILIASLAEMITEEEAKKFITLSDEEIKACPRMTHIKKVIRPNGKATNYGAQYGQGAKGIARAAKVALEVAQLLYDAYWEANWSVKEIAKNTTVKEAFGEKWQFNPVSGIWYWLKAEKDRFSTLCQGTGSFVFDMWVESVFQICNERWGRDPMIQGQFHDEFILKLKENHKELWTGVVREAMDRTNKILQMNREMDCDIQFGSMYSQIH
jgi:hypothetical protein